MQRRSILHVLNSAKAGGTENWVLDFVSHEMDDFESQVLLIEPTGVMIDEFEPHLAAADRTVRGRLGRIAGVQNLWRAVSDLEPAQIWLHSDLARLHASYLPHRSPRWVAVCHSPWGLSQVDRHLHRLSPRRSWDSVVVVSDPLLHQAGQLAVTSAHLVIPPPRLETPDEDARALRKPLDLVYVARLVEGKGHHLLLEALSLLTSVPSSAAARLTLVGGGPLEESLINSAKELGLANSVDFLGELPNARDPLRKSGIFVHPSESEGLSRSGIEAALAALPMVAFDLEAHSHYLTDQTNGRVVRERSAAALAAGIAEVQAGYHRYAAGALTAAIELRSRLVREFQASARVVAQWMP
jgi:glycosyltransferase involved in cell wall biosynthesis